VSAVDEGLAPEPAIAAPDLLAVESFLCEVWRELLGASGEVTDTDFFALGGHSFMAIEVISRLKETFGIDVPFWLILESTTPRLLAHRALHFEGE
jgi:fengycin family lipopeptide synthetase D